MAIVRWEPMRELGTLQSEVNRLFTTMLDGSGDAQGARRWAPSMDLIERADAYLLRADLPGVHDEDVSLEFEDGVLTVSGERKPAEDFDGAAGYRVERPFGRFARSLTLPPGTDGDAITARFERGVLEVRVPKPEAVKPRRIRIGTDRDVIEA